MPRNLLLLMTDQQRYDTLNDTVSPHLSRLGSQGVRFDNAYSVCALCSPARASMLSGLYPHNHRLLKNTEWCQPTVSDLPREVRLISQSLGERGYRCGYIGKWHCGIQRLPRDFDFEGMNVPGYGSPYATQEYRDYLKRYNLERPRVVKRIEEGAPEFGGTLSGPPEACSPSFLAQLTIDMLKEMGGQWRRGGQPFMLFVTFWGPHASYNIPEPYASLYDPEEIQIWGNFNDSLDGKPRIQRRFLEEISANTSRFGEAVWRRVIAQYFGFCTYLDREIGRILEALRTFGLEEDTAVLFTTDHGDMTGSHGGFFDKGPFMYEETYHIPFVARIPGVVSVRSDHLVSNLDLAATVLDLAKIPIPQNYDSRSLLPILRNPNGPWREDLTCEFHGHRFFYSQRMVRFDRYKYILNVPDRDELYDLAEDPMELHNLIDDPCYRPVLHEGKHRLMQSMEESRDGMIEGIREMLR